MKHSRWIDCGDLLTTSCCHKLIVDEESSRKGDLAAIGCFEVDLEGHVDGQSNAIVVKLNLSPKFI